jgi:glycerol-3-phosphate dehydrogenase (NAD(P)+)
MRACVIGSGSFGTALANVLAHTCDEVRIWGRDPEILKSIRERHENPRYLAGVRLSPKITASSELPVALEEASIVVSATPSHATRDVMGKAAAFIPARAPIVTVAKGIENETLLTMTEVLQACLPSRHHASLAVLSGPSFAREMAQGLPTVVTIASDSKDIAKQCQALFQTDTFRAYTSSDVIGVQLGGALKNVIAIAAGMSDGLGFGHNARAGLITRGLAEITRMAVQLGGHPLTLSGLAGLGDLVLTCTGELSRNRRVGLELGRGRKLADILAETTQVAEGVRTAKSARDLVTKTGVELPICEQVYAITHEDKPAKQAFLELMSRQLKPEH